MKFWIGQKLWARWDLPEKMADQNLVMQIPVKIVEIGNGITVVEDREDRALNFRGDGTYTDAEGTLVRLVPRPS